MELLSYSKGDKAKVPAVAAKVKELQVEAEQAGSEQMPEAEHQ